MNNYKSLQTYQLVFCQMTHWQINKCATSSLYHGQHARLLWMKHWQVVSL